MKKRILFCMVIVCMYSTGAYLQVQANCTTCEDEVLQAKVKTNQDETRYPQTIIHDIVMTHLQQPLPKGKTSKKVLVLGYDGFREDAIDNVMDASVSSIKTVSNMGGLYHSYAGADGLQTTYTAPGWASILTGKWGYLAGVSSNEDVKDVHSETFLSEALKLGYTSTFLSSWNGHFDVTYKADIENPLNHVSFQRFNDDEETITNLQRVLQDTRVSSYDVVFGILEYSDHVGHAFGFENSVPNYVSASMEADLQGYQIVQSILGRSTYDQEDWLILLTSDHGGIGMDHGGQSDEEVNTWFAMNKSLTEFTKTLSIVQK